MVFTDNAVQALITAGEEIEVDHLTTTRCKMSSEFGFSEPCEGMIRKPKQSVKSAVVNLATTVT